MFDNISILNKFLCVIAVPLLFQVLFIVALFSSQAENRKAQSWAIHTKEVIAQAESVSRLLIQSQSSVRALIVTGDRTFADENATVLRRSAAELKKLRALVADNEQQGARVDQIADEAVRLSGRLDETSRLMLAGDVEAAVGRVKSPEVRKANDEFRGHVEAFLREEERLDRLRGENLLREWAHQKWFLTAAAAATVAVAVGLIFAFSRAFAGRVETLSENARRLAEGKPLAAPLRGSDEIGRLDASFHHMARTLADREQENEMFIYSVSHDLRSPLVNLQGFGKELAFASEDLEGALGRLDVPEPDRRRLKDILESDIKGSIHFISVAVTRLSGIIDALLRLSRAGRVEYRWQPVDVQAAVTRVVEALRGSAAEKEAEFTVERLPPAWGDPNAVEQVFANLITNAVNYLDPHRSGRIVIGADGDAGAADGTPRLRTYFVRDNGLGIPGPHQGKLFLAFQRLHPDVAQGEGIGLAVARRTIERHGGRIWAESEAGVGSTFFLTLPADPSGGPSTDERKRLVYGQKDGHHGP